MKAHHLVYRIFLVGGFRNTDDYRTLYVDCLGLLTKYLSEFEGQKIIQSLKS